MKRPERTRPRTFFPTAINHYRNCPERYYHQYILKRKRPQPFSRPMVAGGAAHRLIAAVLPGFILSGEPPEDLLSRARSEIQTAGYPAGEASNRERDARDVFEWTLAALDMIPAGATSLLLERSLFARLGRTEVQIGARVDLVLRCPGGEIEHIDFKTGKISDNTVQSIMARTVVGRKFRRAAKVMSSTYFLQHRQRHSVEFGREANREDWQDIARDIRAIRSMDHFPPRPGPLCEFCPYQARDCSVW